MKQIERLVAGYPLLAECSAAIEAAASQIIASYKSGGKLLVCGNGGSCADAAHIVGELMKAFVLPRALTNRQCTLLQKTAPEGAKMAKLLQQGLPAIDLSAHTALLTAFQNDVDPSLCFAQQAFVYAKKNDIFLGISTSGNADNVVNAGVAAKAKGAVAIALVGAKKCRMDDICDTIIHVPKHETYQIQEYHLPIYHAICLTIEEAFFGGGGHA